MKNTRICVVGLGGMGTNHCRILKKIANLVGVCDINHEKALSAGKSFRVKHFTSIIEMCTECKPQAAVVAVNTEHHKNVAIELIKNNTPLLVEKPIASSVKDALSIINAAKKKNVFLMVGMVERHNPTVERLKADIAKGIFGDIYQIVAMRVGISAPNMNPRSVDIDLSVHDVDIVNYLLNEYPRQVTKTGNNYLSNSRLDTCSMSLIYKKTTATIVSNWMSPVKIRKLFIFGQNMSAEVNLLNQMIYYYSKIPLKAITKSNYYTSFQELGAYSRQVSFKKSEPLVKELKVFLTNFSSGFKNDFCENGLKAIKIITSTN